MMDDLDDQMPLYDESGTVSYVSNLSERVVFTWPISNFSEEKRPLLSKSHQTINSTVSWQFKFHPFDMDNQGNAVLSLKVNISHLLGFKINMEVCIRDVHNQEVYKVPSSVCRLFKENERRLEENSSTSHKVTLMPRGEVMSHHATLLPDNTLTIVVKMLIEQEQRSENIKSNVSHFLVNSSSLSCDLGEAFATKNFTDMTIVCDKREFHCHKFMLAARSEVFAAMLRHEFLEKQSSRVDVKEIDGDVMAVLLKYIYTGQVLDFTNVSVVDLFKASDRYRLDHLKQICEEELVKRVEAVNAADILSLAHKYNAQLLKSFALVMISRNIEEVMRTRGWKELIMSDQGLLVEAFDSLARYNTELKSKVLGNKFDL